MPIPIFSTDLFYAKDQYERGIKHGNQYGSPRNKHLWHDQISHLDPKHDEKLIKAQK